MFTRYGFAAPTRWRDNHFCVFIIAALVVPGASPLRAQTSDGTTRREAAFTIGGSLGDGDTALASTAGIAFRLSSRLGLALELAHARKLDFTFDLCPAPLVCVRGGRLPVTGRTVSLVPQVFVDLLPPSHRLRLYAMGGAGAGHVRQRWFDGPTESTRSSLTLALSVGAGAALRVSRRLAIGVDVGSLHLLDRDPSLNRFISPAGTLSTLRVGSRVGWAF